MGVTYLAQTLDHAGVAPNPARDKVQVKLPREEREELEPPLAEHVEAVHRLLPRMHRLPLLWLDWSAPASAPSTPSGRRLRRASPSRTARASISKTRKALWVDLPDEFADALEATLGRARTATRPPLFADSGADALRTAIAKAWTALGIPLLSPHDLRHRRISMLHRQGRTWAEIGAFVGQRSARVTSDVYTHVLLDDREVDYRALLAVAA